MPFDALLDVLRLKFNITHFSEVFFQNNSITEIENEYDYIIVISDSNFINSLPYSRKYVIVIDDVSWPDKIDISWYRFQTHTIISFSRSIYESIRSSGLRVAYFQYYPFPESGNIQWAESDHILNLSFGGDGRIRQAKQIISDGLYNSNFYKIYSIEDEQFCEDRINDIVKNFDFFNLSGKSYDYFYWAMMIMSHGKIIISEDDSYISDYVGHCSSGIINDINASYHLPVFDTQLLRKISQGAYQRTRLGRRRWLADHIRLLSLIMNDRRRWSGYDRSASFGNRIRHAASSNAYQAAWPDV